MAGCYALPTLTTSNIHLRRWDCGWLFCPCPPSHSNITTSHQNKGLRGWLICRACPDNFKHYDISISQIRDLVASFRAGPALHISINIIIIAHRQYKGEPWLAGLAVRIGRNLGWRLRFCKSCFLPQLSWAFFLPLLDNYAINSGLGRSSLALMGGWTDGWIFKWINGWIDRWIRGWMLESVDGGS